MGSHKFKVGQLVAFASLLDPRNRAPGRSYKVLQLMPRDGVDYTYRVKTITEAHYRVAKEREIVLL